MTTLTYQPKGYPEAIVVDTDTLPAATLSAYIERGFKHHLGNESASVVVADIRAKIVENTERLASDVSTDEVKAFRGAHADQVAKFQFDAIKDAIEEMNSGTIGVRSGGGTRVVLDPVGREARAMAKAEVLANLSKNGLAMPKKAKGATEEPTIQIGDLQLTMAQLVDRRLANEKFGPRILADAKRVVDARARSLAKGVNEEGDNEF